MAKLSGDGRVTVRTLVNKASRQIAQQLGVAEGAVLYQLNRMRGRAVDGHANQQPVASSA